MGRTAVVAGSTGLVGDRLLKRLLDHPRYERVIALARAPLAFSHPRLEVILTAFDDLDALVPRLSANDAFCCLGTTQAKAGRVGLERVDYHMVVDFARATRRAGARQLLVVSAAGTSARSFSFYSRTKARMEAAVAEIGFEGTHLLRPSLLLGERTDRRPAEALAQRLAPVLSPLMVGALEIYRPVSAEAVADALLVLASRDPKGVEVHHLPL